MKWTKVTITTTNEAVDTLSYMLAEIGIEGIEIEDNIPLSEEDKAKMFVDILPDPVYNDGKSRISCYLDCDDELPGKIKNIQNVIEETKTFLDVGDGTIECGETEDKDWLNNWKEFFKPFRIDPNIIIKPSWEELTDKKEGDIIVEIDPGTAFGTGTHETTSLCIQLINKYMKAKDVIYDVGCGSGILGITASKLGAEKVMCIDIDEVAVETAKENIQKNQVDHNVIAKEGNLLETEAEPANMVVANILAEVILVLTPEVKRFLQEEGLFIASGILNEKADLVIHKMKEEGFQIREVLEKGSWTAICARR